MKFLKALRFINITTRLIYGTVLALFMTYEVATHRSKRISYEHPRKS